MKKYLYLLAVGIFFAGCSSETAVERPAKTVTQKEIVPTEATASTLAITATTENGGTSGEIKVSGLGTMETTSIDADGNKTIQPYTFKGSGSVALNLTKDTLTVDKFGVELLSHPSDINSTEIENDSTMGKRTTMASWKFSDGQTATGIIEWLYNRAKNDVAAPHAEVENLDFKRVVSVEPVTDSTATVTLAFTAEVKGVNANAVVGDVGEQEIWVSYTQLLSYKLMYELSFAKNGSTYAMSFTAKDNRGGEWSREIVPFSVGNFNDMDTCYVSSTDLISKVEDIVPNDPSDKTVTKNRATYHTVEVCNLIKDHRNWRSNGGGLVGPKMNVYFRTQSLEVTFPRGEKVLVKLDQKSIFGEDKTSTNNSLEGVVRLPNEDTEYVYAHSHTYSASHYVTCTVVDWNGERNVPITILPTADSGGWQQLQYNVCTTNLYVLK